MANDKREQAMELDEACNTLKLVAEHIEASPSEGVKVYDGVSVAIRRILSEFTQDAGHAARQQQWVDVADGLPITSGLYWTVCVTHEKQLFDSVRFDALTGKWNIPHHKLIVAWMPIPPYQRPSAVEGDKNDERNR